MFSKFEGSSLSHDLSPMIDLKRAIGFRFVQLFSYWENGSGNFKLLIYWARN